MRFDVYYSDEFRFDSVDAFRLKGSSDGDPTVALVAGFEMTRAFMPGQQSTSHPPCSVDTNRILSPLASS